MDEKLSSEIGTYVRMQNQCSEVRTQHQYGFGFSDRRHVRGPLPPCPWSLFRPTTNEFPR